MRPAVRRNRYPLLRSDLGAAVGVEHVVLAYASASVNIGAKQVRGLKQM
ncbi:hypothetical protein Back11_30710 [Paenibacillus baekrokdamisoli]|uniref:Uncharacterized protein n=1 Tax=Paenibacillus baekrokdamisoli TaxID=1712516 RepID=A0A3G9ITL3_9BACL|nr:hypothetical protein Back11_30710 [Paenibacillus baekrokdamisoli]